MCKYCVRWQHWKQRLPPKQPPPLAARALPGSMTLRPRPTPVKEGASRTVGVRALPARSHSEDSAQRRRGDAVSARRSHRATVLRKSKMSAQKADRRIREQPARSRTPAAALPGGKTEISKPRCRSWFCSSWFCGSGDMKLHCEVEVISRHLPALGLRNRGKGVRAMLILCQQTPKSQQRPQAGGERGGPHPAYLLISTLKDKRGTRYEVRGESRPCGGWGKEGAVSHVLFRSAERRAIPEAGVRLRGS